MAKKRFQQPIHSPVQVPPPSVETQKLLQLSEISLWLDTYDDIFSDFDPRPYSQRALSDDFLYEAKKASRDKSIGTIELQFLLPLSKRSPSHEFVIRRRLHDHFKRHALLLEKDASTITHRGVLFILLGVFVMFIASLILFEQRESFFLSFLIVVMEPAGWFLFWEGLHLIVFESKKLHPDLDFYKKMARCEIHFLSY